MIFTTPPPPQSQDLDRSLVPMTEDQIRKVEQIAIHPAQRLIIALLAVHAAGIVRLRYGLTDGQPQQVDARGRGRRKRSTQPPLIPLATAPC